MIVVAGEALIDMVSRAPGSPDYTAVAGGGAANTAIALARLGAPASLLARLADDEFGRRIRTRLATNGVDLAGAVKAAEPTTLALATLDEQAVATYQFYLNGTADFQWHDDELPATLDPAASALVVGTLAMAVQPGATALERLLAREHARGAVTTVYDPNLRPALFDDRAAERARVERQLGYAHVAKASEQDIDWLYPGESIERVSRRWRDAGALLVVITRGPHGAYALTPAGSELSLPGRAVTVTDTVGAGDAFTAGMLDGLRRRGLIGGAAEVAGVGDAAVHAALTRAIVVSALTCQRRGAEPPDAAEVAAAGG